MSRANMRPHVPPPRTHEGGPAHRQTLDPLTQLRRSVLSCMLWESEFYEDGQSIADRIRGLVQQCSPFDVAALARKARGEFKLRHVPLLLTAILADHSKGGSLIADLTADVVRRADEMGELLAIRQKITGQPNVRKALTHGLRRGLARAMVRFDEYQLGKYDRDSAAVKLRDVLYMVHPDPAKSPRVARTDERKITVEQASDLLIRARDRKLATPDTWEAALSAGADKRETFTRLLGEGQLGYLALLRNLRNMEGAGVDRALIREALLARKNGAEGVLPFQFVAAAQYVPALAGMIDEALKLAIADQDELAGFTVWLVDVSGSMYQAKISAKSELDRGDAAAALAGMAHCQDSRVFTFSERLVEVPALGGMACIESIRRSQHNGGTWLGRAVRELASVVRGADRLIVITDEQSHDGVPPPPANLGRGYMINVASAQHGVGYGPWVHLDGFSEAVLRWVAELERSPTSAPDGTHGGAGSSAAA